MEREDAEFKAAHERITKMAEDLRKAKQVRDGLEELYRHMGSDPEGYDMRTRPAEPHIQHPRGTRDPAEEAARILKLTSLWPCL